MRGQGIVTHATSYGVIACCHSGGLSPTGTTNYRISKEKVGLKRRGADKNGEWYFEADEDQ